MTRIKKEYGIRFTEEGSKKIERRVGGIDRAFDGVVGKVKGLGVAALASAASFAAFESIQIAGQFEALEVRLQSLTGSIEKGTELFDTLKQVAASTPFAVAEVVEAGAALEAYGLSAEKNIKLTADLAARMGVSIPVAAGQLGRAYAAGAGAADLFREKGINMLIQTSQGIDDLSKISLPEFREAMFKAFEDPKSGIIGSTDRLAQTFQGKLSNMQDALQNLGNTIGGSFLEETKGALDRVTGLVNAVNTLLSVESEDSGFSKFVKLLGTANKVLENLTPVGRMKDAFEFVERKLLDAADAVDKSAEVGKAYAAVQQEINDLLLGSADVFETDVVPGINDYLLVVEKAEFTNRMFNLALRGGVESGRFFGEVLNTLREDDINKFADKLDEVGRSMSDPVAGDFNFWDVARDQVSAFGAVFESTVLNQFREGGGLIDNFFGSLFDHLTRLSAMLASKSLLFGLASIFGGPFGTAVTGGAGFLDFLFGGGFGNLTAGPTPGIAGNAGSPTLIIQTLDAESFDAFLSRGGAERISAHMREIVN